MPHKDHKHTILNSMWCAFSTYSKIPVPKQMWTEESLRWQIAWFPLVGVVIGLLWLLAAMLLAAVDPHPVLTGALLTVLPLVLTGGIHMDGFMDTSDALHSWRDREEKLRILKDPHIGAFAVISAAVYLILTFGFAAELATLMKPGPSGACLTAIALGFIYSRIFSAISVVRFSKAKTSGMLASTAEASHRAVAGVLYAELAAALILTLFPAWLLQTPIFLLVPVISALVFWYYHHMAMTTFCGITGDLAGWFLQVCELAVLAAVTIVTLL